MQAWKCKWESPPIPTYLPSLNLRLFTASQETLTAIWCCDRSCLLWSMVAQTLMDAWETKRLHLLSQECMTELLFHIWWALFMHADICMRLWLEERRGRETWNNEQHLRHTSVLSPIEELFKDKRGVKGINHPILNIYLPFTRSLMVPNLFTFSRKTPGIDFYSRKYQTLYKSMTTICICLSVIADLLIFNTRGQYHGAGLAG